MRAIVFRDYGDPDVLHLEDRPDPEYGGDEVLIQVAAASVNPVDARLRQGEMKWLLPGGFPRIPGYDVAGTVVAAGDRTHFKPGDRVVAFLDHLYGGASAERAVCSADSMIPIGDAVPFDEAAAIPLAASTALQSLRDHGKMQSGDRVLINGASGGVGAFAVQIAAAYGATVTGVAGGSNEAFVRDLGAAEFIDYEKTSFADSGQKWDVIFDAAGKSSFGKAKAVLTEDGRYVSTEPSLKNAATSLLSWPMDQQSKVMLAQSRAEDLTELMRLYDAGQLKVTIARRFPLAEAAAAHRMIENDSFRGKIVLTVDAAPG
ncbi:NAD(P)-dependent alcohol dehydrogenase [Alienimonas californiensis]|uniref:Quinone oxidoreductase 1 n=1 Tax=Alienimonas californiensis TaxID=2527989 RepID=A0A517P639_9PLAN|nr:NAD(P)-dependent alcohol dehydrogenase [Alienimonas californiensis]QDT14815.1 Quinone oxidoreductase 1 [Alienimonas californiensis]